MLIVGNEPPLPFAVTAPRFPANSTLDAIQRRGCLRVGVVLDLPGFASRDLRNGEVCGLEADIARVLAQHIFGGSLPSACQHVEFVAIPFDQHTRHLCERTVDAVLANLADTPERRQSIRFAGHYISSPYAPVVKSSAPDITCADELNGLRIAVVGATTGPNTLLSLAPEAQPVHFGGASDCARAVIDGEVDAYWGSRIINIGLVRQTDGKLRETSLNVGNERWGVGLHKEDRVFGEFIDEVVHNVLEAGALNASFRRLYDPR